MAVHKNMAITQDQKAHLAKDHRHFVYEGLTFAYQRGHELSNEFMRLEIQIAAVLFAFAAFFLGYVASVPDLWMRGAFARARQLRLRKWQRAVDEAESFEEARAFDAGVSDGVRAVTSLPLWGWMLQS